uniref:Uncharacterized protein n=1 Tax=Salix viminalis TaxID=40686 RepID=A0A6N2M197_SALVM
MGFVGIILIIPASPFFRNLGSFSISLPDRLSILVRISANFTAISDTTDLVHVLEWQAEGLVRGPLGLLDLVKGLQESWSLVPVQVGGPLDHVITLKSRDRHEGNLVRVVTDLLQVR